MSLRPSLGGQAMGLIRALEQVFGFIRDLDHVKGQVKGP